MGGLGQIESKSSFYLGRLLDGPDAKSGTPVLLDSADLTTHAACVGMTGSGKTGLGIGLLEEAALDGIPVIAIDPKGDLGNMLLTFPNLDPQNFARWINADEAVRRGLTVERYAEEISTLWREGLARDGQDVDRIRRLRQAADFRIYTPGSNAGLPVSIVQTLAPPADLDWDRDAEILRERIESAVSALLALVGIEADPVRSREHILLTNIIQIAWQEGRGLDLADLIRAVQKPPLSQLGVFDLDAFFPEKDRMELALMLNAIIASPAFNSWLEGDPLDPALFLRAPDGRPRVSIFSIAHLDDRERLFFITLLLEQMVAWMRSQTGASGLRAILYFDEIFGFLPPYPRNPASKRPLLTLLKQARAVGLGLVLATQNPVDLDYKALSNAGVWFIGRLQTEQDRERLLDGLMTVRQSGVPLNRNRLQEIIGSLPSRTFVMNNVHDPGPKVFRTRWVMSYLSGPMARDQIRALMDPFKKANGYRGPERSPSPEGKVTPGTQSDRRQFCAQCGARLADSIRFCPQCGARIEVLESPAENAEQSFKEQLRQETAPVTPDATNLRAEPPILPASVSQFFLPTSKPKGRAVVYRAVALAEASVAILDQSRDVDFREDYLLALDPPEEGRSARWEAAEKLDYDSSELASGPAPEAHFGPVPDTLNAGPKLTALKKQLSDHLYINTRVALWHHPKLKLFSRIDEDEDDFRKRVKRAAEDQRDEEVEKLKDRFETRMERVEDQLRRKQHELGEAEAEFAARKRTEALSAAESVLGFLTKRRSSTAFSRASGKRQSTERAKLRIDRTKDYVDQYEAEIDEIKHEMEKSVREVHDDWAEKVEDIQEFQLRPRRADVRVSFVALGWKPE